ncbi:MAG: DNA polymerase III subunit gamma/tau [Anaerolineales bacterium]|jgi:DNA polymerase-3 subunit gamma/tau
MTYALYRKWRPQKWEDVVGQDHVVQTLRNALRSGRQAHAYLFAGPRGTGKTTTARLLAKALNCTHEPIADRPCGVCANCQAVAEGRFLDLIEIDAASNTSVDDVRDLRDRINFAPNEGRYKVYIIDEVHMLSTAAFNALLKTLEEPPEHAVFVLATTEVHKIPATVLSRCQRHEFRRLPVSTMVAYLQSHLKEESIEIEPAALELIARQATGSMRDAISLLDQLASTGQRVTLSQAEDVLGTAASESVRATVRAIVAGEAGQGLSAIHAALDRGADARQFARQVVDLLRGLLLAKMGNRELIDATPETRAEIEDLASACSTALVLRAIKAFGAAASDRRTTWMAALPLEIALVETLAADPGSDPPPTAQSSPVSRPAPQSTKPPADEGGGEGDQARAEARPAGRTTEAESHGEISFETIVEHWREVLQSARKRDPRVQALLNSCRPLGLEKGKLVIGFSSDLLREKMEKEHNLSIASQALAEVCQMNLGLRCLLTEAWQGGRENQPAAPTPMESDGMVATAIRELGAQVVEVEQWPPENRPQGSSS